MVVIRIPAGEYCVYSPSHINCPHALRTGTKKSSEGRKCGIYIQDLNYVYYGVFKKCQSCIDRVPVMFVRDEVVQ